MGISGSRSTRTAFRRRSTLNQNFYHLPIREVHRGDTRLLISVRILEREVFARLWELRVGRVNLYLLDTDIPENNAEDRLITAELYGGDLEMRMRQEMMLGIGGVKALAALGIQPAVFHMNEGHSAFLALERIRLNVVEKKLDFYSALQLVAAANVFTTHTPVPAGNDSFPREMMRKYFGNFAKELNIPFDELFSFGHTRLNPDDPFSMTILALRLSRHANGVSKLHGEVSRSLWKDVWSGVPVHEVPITSITNGVHTKTWMAPEFAALYRKHLGDWEEHLAEPEFWRGVIDIHDTELWDTHQQLKLRLINFIRDRERHRRERLGESPESIRKVNRILDPEILTVGFARRFATYKRGTLLFSDKERLKRLVNDTTRPVQFIFAGKAHPRDEAGKALIQEVYRFSREAGSGKSHRFSGGLRQLHRAPPGAGCRSLAKPSVASPGGERNQRNEGCSEWRNQSERTRWLVARRVQRQQWLGYWRRNQQWHHGISK